MSPSEAAERDKTASIDSFPQYLPSNSSPGMPQARAAPNARVHAMPAVQRRRAGGSSVSPDARRFTHSTDALSSAAGQGGGHVYDDGEQMRWAQCVLDCARASSMAGASCLVLSAPVSSIPPTPWPSMNREESPTVDSLGHGGGYADVSGVMGFGGQPSPMMPSDAAILCLRRLLSNASASDMRMHSRTPAPDDSEGVTRACDDTAMIPVVVVRPDVAISLQKQCVDLNSWALGSLNPHQPAVLLLSLPRPDCYRCVTFYPVSG